ncbi:hypothetical protein CJU89_0175 [Yarrowia sp. B02]|nr:hypothetical protein CJU89_0175 [Yarrowia sp. B02]
MTDYCFGIETPCTPLQLVKDTADVFSKCTLPGVGHFYFVCKGQPDAPHNVVDVHLKFYDNKKQVLHSSSSRVFTAVRTLKKNTIALDPYTFLVGEVDQWNYLFMSKDWSSSNFTSTGCGSNKHPVQLQASYVIVELIVRYFYGQPLEMTFEDATHLILVAQMYGLPELQKQATIKIRGEKMTGEQCVMAWKKCVEANNDGLRQYCACEMRKVMTDVLESPALYESLSKDELSLILADLCPPEKKEEITPKVPTSAAFTPYRW